jgi:hypothetical protein
MKKVNQRKGCWTFPDAQKTIPLVRCLLASLREHYIACWHYIRLNGHDPDCHEFHPRCQYHREEAEAALNELFGLGVGLFESPIHGIALFPFMVEVQLDEVATEERVAYLVYRDTREQIESFVFAIDRHNNNGLVSIERSIPDKLKIERAEAEPDHYGSRMPFLPLDQIPQPRS